MCTRFEKSPKDFSSFFDVINSGKNLVDIPKKSMVQRGSCLGGKNLARRPQRRMHLIAADAEASAIKINEEMERIMGKGKGFTNFVDDFMKKLKVDFPNKIQRSLPQLSPAGIPPAPGSNGGAIFVDATDATIARCKAGKRSSVWLAARDLFVRQVTGKKPLPKDCKQVTDPKASTNKSTAKASTKEIAKPSNPKPGAKVPPARTETKASPKLPAKPAAKPPAKKPVAKAPGKKAVSKKTRRDD
ncbi:hypothetical protein VNI00_012828 [Paramarasmius palmivorus]|uniref:Uncharacterized protein n=1 Tax=Paramarasmius palmivorus TaxID=297713 RepID=A0AAW0C4R5_9AGAR